MSNTSTDGNGASVDTTAYDADNYKARKQKRSKKPIIITIIVVLVILAILGACGFAFAQSVKEAKSDANKMVSQGKEIVKLLKGDDKAKLQKTAANFSTTAKKLNETVNGPLWSVASVMPVYGSDVSQVRTLSAACDTLSTKVLIPIVDDLPENCLKGIYDNKTFNVSVITNMLGPLGNASSEISQYAKELNSAGDVHFDQIKEPVATAKTALNALDTIAKEAPQIAKVLPNMLGNDGLRNYLILACNNSEIRSTGGMPGQFGILSMDHGKMEISDFAGYAAVPKLEGSARIPISAEEERLYGQRVSSDMRDVNFIPDFSRVAVLEKALWEAHGKREVVGVIGVDPIFLQRLLSLTGGFTTSAGIEVNGDNAAELILNGIYLRYGNNNAATDAFFSEVASRTIEQVFGNLSKVDITKLIEVCSKSFKDRHFYAWMQNADEEAIIDKIGCSGKILNDPTHATTGLYFGSAMGCKIFWYLDVDTQVTNERTNADGSKSYDMKVVFKNTLSEGDANNMPEYVVGEDPAQRGKSDMPIDIYLYAPAGGKITNMQTTGFFQDSGYFNSGWNTQPGPDPMSSMQYNGFEVWFGMTQILGNQETTLSYTVTTSTQAKGALDVDMTPLPNEKLQ